MVTQWISYAQSLSMLGIIGGYLLGTCAADAKYFGIDGWFSWQRAFFTQGIALYIIAAFFMCWPNEALDIMAVADEDGEEGHTQISPRASAPQGSRPDQTPRSSKKRESAGIPMLNDVFALLSNPIYMSTMFVITSMYFSVTGLQFWTI